MQDLSPILLSLLGHLRPGVRERLFRRGRVRARHGAEDADRSADRGRAPRRARRAARPRHPTVHRRHAARHHDGQPGARLGRRAGGRALDRAGARRSCRPTIAEATAHSHRGRDRVRRHHRAAHRPSASWRRRRSRSARRSDALLVAHADASSSCAPSGRSSALLNGWAGRRSWIGLRAPSGHALVHSEEELKMLVTASQEAGVLEEEEEQMLHRVFGFATSRPDR